MVWPLATGHLHGENIWLVERHGPNKYHLVGGIPTPLKNMKVSWEYDSQYMETTCSKAPTSHGLNSQNHDDHSKHWLANADAGGFNIKFNSTAQPLTVEAGWVHLFYPLAN